MPPFSGTIALARRKPVAASLLPLVLLLAAALFANLGAQVARDAHAATDSIIVSATVSPVASTATNGCAADTMTIAFTMNTLSAGTCTITFGSTNASGITLSGEDASQADQFFTQGANNFADATGSCAALAGDQVGFKVLAASSAGENLCGAGGQAAGNTGYSDIPNDTPAPVGPDTLCTTSSSGNQTCVIDVGINEASSDAPAATYTGTITVTSS